MDSISLAIGKLENKKSKLTEKTDKIEKKIALKEEKLTKDPEKDESIHEAICEL